MVDKRSVIQSDKDKVSNEDFRDLLENCPIPQDEKLNNLGLFIKRQNMSRVIFFYELYKKILNVHGSIIMFGVRWGQDVAMLEAFRGMLEPFNYNRKIIGFDTFEGFPSITMRD